MLITVTHKILAEVNLAGIAIGAVGGLYLAYDLLGGRTGPLKTIARATGYMIFFFIGYAVLIGVQYALIASLGMGIILAIEFRRAAFQPRTEQSKTVTLFFAFFRGLVLGLAGIVVGGISFGASFGLLTGFILSIQYYYGFSPTADYKAHTKPKISTHNLFSSALRALGVGIAAILACWITKPHTSWSNLALRLGGGAGFVSSVVGQLSPSVEWWVDRLPDRQLGVFGLVLVFLGMFLQATESIATVLSIDIR